ncbi:MAG: MarR family transcriptional regulator [Rhodospirillaceae bacterium]|nr:MarR family transcriptional regulator [Rhodospirillaceae bacterium]
MTRRPARKANSNEPAGPPPAGPPYVGALLRLSWQRVRRHIDEAVRAKGFTDLRDAHLAVFSYPPPDGVRLSDLARQLRMSRQATNYLVGQLEELDYLERRAAPGSERRLIHLTARGRKVVAALHASLRALQAQWAREIGRERFADFMEVLRILSTQAPPSPAG